VEEVLSQISNLGFPIAVSIYLLVRFENKIESLTISINELTRVIETLK